MNNNWDNLLKLTIMLFFGAIWALTSLFNRESKPAPARPPGPRPSTGPKPGEPTLRWAPPPSAPTARRVPIGDDDILIIGSDAPRPAARPGPRRQSKARAAAPAPKPVEPAPSRPKLGGVSQSVSQHLNRTSLGLAPATGSPPTLEAGRAWAGKDAKLGPVVQSITASLADPARLREAFVLNEILQRPISLRGHGLRRR